MRLYLMRHGIAIDRADPGCPEADADRPLTQEGRERTRLALHGLVSLGVVVDRIVSSPLLRCLQTAELGAEALGVPRLALETHAGLVPGGDPTDLCAVLRSLPDDGVLIVGHAPDLDLMAARLLGLPGPVTALKKSGVAVLSQKPGAPTARLLGVYEPKTLRRLGRSE
ncbi:MAG: phosphohistidine phosphatase SixA [Deltaproteobacteria bacterium]|nr:phosphohistidine phosphatase SixA [Deltaproteobacteria bacterium]